MSDVRSVNAGPAQSPGAARAKLMENARQLESVFYGQLFQAMRATVSDSGSEHGVGEKMFTGMLDDEIAKLATHQTDRGLAASIYRELSRRLPPETAAPVAAPGELPNAAAR